VLADQVRDGGGVVHDFVGGDAAAAGGPGNERLGENGGQGDAEDGADLLLLAGGESVDDTVDGGGGADGVEGAEDKVAGFRRGDGGLDRLEVAHFADENDVRVLTQGAAQGVGERRGVDVDFPLGNDRFLCLWVYSTGSSMVMMCTERLVLIQSMMVASEVVCPSRWGRSR
jgi:hypothetical protein